MAFAFVQRLGAEAFNYVLGVESEPTEVHALDGLIDLQCGRTVFHDVPARMRTELWLSQLQRSREGMQAVQEYSHLVSRVGETVA